MSLFRPERHKKMAEPSKRKSKIDPNQKTFDFNFTEKIDHHIRVVDEIQSDIDAGPDPVYPVENEFEACVEIAAAIKAAIRESGLSREQVVDDINAYFGRTEAGSKTDPPECRNPLTINVFNNYLSKPAECPMPAYYLYAVHRVTGHMHPARVIVAAEGAKVATGREIKQMTLGKLEELAAETRKLKKELSKR